MKCNIARDLIPLYDEGLCERETALELEEHFAECESCRALTKKIAPEPEERAADIRPFRKIGKKFMINRIVIAALALVTAAILFTAGVLTYGELNRESGYMSFSRIFMDIDVRRIGSLLEKGDIEGFAEYVYIGGDYSDILLGRLVTAYNDELAGRECRVKEITNGQSDVGGVTRLESQMTLELEGVGEVTLCLVEADASKYHMYVTSGSEEPFELKTVQTLNLIYNFKMISERAEEIDKNPRYIVPYFNNGRTDIAEMAAKLDEFTADGSELVTAFVSVPLYDGDRDEFYCKCMIRMRDGAGIEAVAEFRAVMGGTPFLNADISAAEIINGGMSEEKIGQALDIFLEDN